MPQSLWLAAVSHYVGLNHTMLPFQEAAQTVPGTAGQGIGNFGQNKTMLYTKRVLCADFSLALWQGPCS